jgi:hypothetical protein
LHGPGPFVVEDFMRIRGWATQGAENGIGHLEINEWRVTVNPDNPPQTSDYQGRSKKCHE